jgi:hypothetical protein
MLVYLQFFCSLMLFISSNNSEIIPWKYFVWKGIVNGVNIGIKWNTNFKPFKFPLKHIKRKCILQMYYSWNGYSVGLNVNNYVCPVSLILKCVHLIIKSVFKFQPQLMNAVEFHLLVDACVTLNVYQMVNCFAQTHDKMKVILSS